MWGERERDMYTFLYIYILVLSYLCNLPLSRRYCKVLDVLNCKSSSSEVIVS